MEEIPTLLDVARDPGDMDVPGYRLHPLKGDRKGLWSVGATANLADHLPVRTRGRARREFGRYGVSPSLSFSAA